MIEFPTVLDDLMMAQQPILKKSKDIFGYELLFRGKDALNANVSDGESATSQVLVNLCIGITKLESQLRKPFFINMTTELMLSDAFFPIDPDTVYIEILESQKLTPEFFEALKKWRAAGYRFALDDYQFDADYEALLPWVSIVKIDILSTPPENFIKEINELKARGLILLAEKVENEEMFEYCKKIGFDLFQGYFLQRPEIIKGKKIDSATHAAIELVNALQDKDISIETVSDLVTKNPKLSYQLLRILNSPVCGLSKTVVSIKEAVIFLGLVQLKKWALLITLTSSSTQPKALFKVLLTRGRCCQLLAQNKQSAIPDSAFMVGLMSGIDAVFNVQKSVALEQIALDDLSRAALMNQTGELGSYLSLTLDCEEQHWDNIQSMSPAERAMLNRAFLDAMLWSEEVMQSIN
ncbi:EAL and HDOD domain-containing protein [Marinomonas foliarum]|uniref:HDOD domain-containing protein n=1 Tax=Marinomonas foliarum TaxID=491950 RepID=A0ABX7IMJ8_9GAMM|nr:HDOD domain-containing protein [Marinomonas foliarum]QRV23351.1 HDOD domain-containing protein [Marinomonas foliarum]